MVACTDKKHLCQCAIIYDEPVVLLDILLVIHTIQVGTKPLLSHLSIESSPGSKVTGKINDALWGYDTCSICACVDLSVTTKFASYLIF